MSDTDGLEYLQTGFDPASLTVPRLRSILVSHSIDYPSSAKKSQLIEIFNDRVVPQSRKLLAARDRARRTSKGITDADSQDSTQESNLADEELMPPPPTPRVRSRKTPSKIKSEESESDAPATRSPTKKTPRASKHARATDTETETDQGGEVKTPGRKARKSVAPTPVPAPQIKTEDEDDGAHLSRRRQSAFTYDNPFQSGSSPLDGSRSTSGERKVRKSLGPSAGKDAAKRKSTPSKRRTDIPKANDGIHPPTSSTFEIPVSGLDGFKDIDDNGVEASEEFTPDEQLELSLQRAASGADVLPRRPKRQPSRGISKKGPLWVAALTLLGGYSAWYRQEKVAVGYCGVGREATQVIPAGYDVPDWVRILVEPECEACPQHAYCSENLVTNCEHDFVLKPHPLSVAGLVPLPPTCEPDGEKVRRVKAVADRAVEELRERKAKFECGDLTDSAGAPEPTVEIDADELKKEVSKKRRKGMSEVEFEELWDSAIPEIEGRDEVVKVADGHRSLLSSTSLARLPLGCTIRRSFRLALARHRLKIIAVVFFAGLYLYVRQLFSSRAAANAAVPNLVSLTLDRLVTQASLHAQDRESVPEAWVSIGQLRDDVLRDEHSIRKREALWTKVKKVVEMNANVRASQREGRNGEISRVWEWIGALSGAEDAGKRRKSGRVSWGVYDEMSSPVSGTDGGPEVVQMKWEEGRPIY